MANLYTFHVPTRLVVDVRAVTVEEARAKLGEAVRKAIRPDGVLGAGVALEHGRGQSTLVAKLVEGGDDCADEPAADDPLFECTCSWIGSDPDRWRGKAICPACAAEGRRIVVQAVS